MDGTVVIAIAGLASTTLAAFGAPFIQGRIAAKAAIAGRVHERQLSDQANIREQQMATYISASAHVDAIQEQLNHLTRPVEVRSGERPPNVAAASDITGRLRLLGSWDLFQDWRKLISAYNWLVFTLSEEGPADEHGEYYVSNTDPGVRRVQAAIDTVTNHLRVAVGVGELGEVDGH